MSSIRHFDSKEDMTLYLDKLKKFLANKAHDSQGNPKQSEEEYTYFSDGHWELVCIESVLKIVTETEVLESFENNHDYKKEQH